ncbi:MAG: serine/threonine-protein kinase [Polyangiales bacterium]
MSGMRSLSAGMVFAGDFVVQRALAEGGMGAVYVALQRSTGKERALKVMHPNLAASPASRERFVQEARVGSQIDSDHVVEVVGAGVDAETGMPWLAMELLQGEELSKRLERGPLPVDEAREVFDQLCDALGKAHARGVVHRDLKPENVFIATARRRGVPFTLKILDFGIAKILKENQTAATVTTAIGSPLWMSPEQGDSNAKLRPATDVWALGLIAFAVLTGKVYWRQGNSETPSLQAILTEVMVMPLVPPSQRAAEMGVGALIPPGFDEWFMGCVQRDPTQRFTDANVAWTALSSVLGTGARPMVSATTQPVVHPTQPLAQTPQVPAYPTQVASQPVVPTPTMNWNTSQGASTTVGPPPKTRGATGMVIGAVVLLLGSTGAVYAMTSAYTRDRPRDVPAPVHDAAGALGTDAGVDVSYGEPA